MPTIPMKTGTTITVRGVTAEVRVDGAEKGIDRGSGPWRRVIYQCDYAESDEFCDGLVGSTTNAGGSGGVLTFPGPHQYPGNPNLRCTEVSAVGIGSARPDPLGKLITYDYAQVVATYRVPTWDALGDDFQNSFGGQPVPYSSCQIRTKTERIPVTRSVFHVGADPSAVLGHVDVPIKEYVFVRHQLPFLPDIFLDPLIGKVNLTAFWGKAAESVKLEEYDTDEEIDSVGNKIQRLEVRLAWRGRYNWNQAPGNSDLDPQAVTDGLGNPPYQKIEFNVFPFVAYP